MIQVVNSTVSIFSITNWRGFSKKCLSCINYLPRKKTIKNWVDTSQQYSHLHYVPNQMSALINGGIPDYPQDNYKAYYSDTSTKVNYSFV